MGSALSRPVPSAGVGALRRLAAFRLSPEDYRRVTFVAVVLLVAIVITGGAVRLTGSGLGCSDWPSCNKTQFVSPVGSLHKQIEQYNRLFTALVSVAVAAAVLGAIVRRPRRKDLLWLACGEVAGVIGQIVLGGLVVLFHLWPPLVMCHFVLSQLLVLDGVILHHRAGRPDGTRPRPAVEPRLQRLGQLLVGLCALALFTGTIVTGAGPHSGANGNQLVKRLPVAISTVARAHGVVDMAFVAAVLAFVLLAHRSRVPARILQRAELVLTVGVLQAAVGYTQYFTGVPELLVGLHIFGATVLWISVLWLYLGLFDHVPAPDRLPEPGAGPADSEGGDAHHHLPGTDLVAQR